MIAQNSARDQERAEFETYLKERIGLPEWRFYRSDEEYDDGCMEIMWTGWLAKCNALAD